MTAPVRASCPQIPSRVPSATGHINTLRCPVFFLLIPHATLAMLNRTLPYYLEDRTGLHTASDYDDIYDRLFLRVACAGQSSPQVARTPSSSSMVTAQMRAIPGKLGQWTRSTRLHASARAGAKPSHSRSRPDTSRMRPSAGRMVAEPDRPLGVPNRRLVVRD